MKRIPFNKPTIVGRELEYIRQAVESGSIAGDGIFTRKVHEFLKSILGCKGSLLTHSGTAALEMAAILCDIQPGDEVIMPSFTFVTTANAVVLRGGVPVFVDIRQDNLNLNEQLIESAITPRTKAIAVVHYAGRACDMDTIMAIAGRYGLRVIEDAAHALASRYRGHSLGTIGHLGCISFHETKNVISGEGGALLINDPELIERAEIIREKGTNRSRFFRGQVDKYTWVDIGSSYLPSELISAFLYAQLEKIEEINEKRRQICRIYHEKLKDISASGRIHISETLEGEDFIGHIFYIITKNLEERSALMQYLRDREIIVVFHYVPLHSSPAGMRYGRSDGDLPVTDLIGDRLLRLPLFLDLTTAEAERVCDEIHNFYRSH